MPVTTTPPPTIAAKRRRTVLLALLLLAAVGAGIYFFARPRRSVVPPIPTEGLDPEVVAVIDKARADVEAQPKSGAAWGHLGMVLFAQDMYEPCVPILAEAERLDPRNPRWPYFQGLALVLERPEDGIAALERAAAIRPRPLAVRLRLAEQCLKLDRLDEADRLCREVLADYSDNARALLGRGEILSRRGQWREAVEPLKKAAEQVTARHSARVALAEAYSRLGETAAAEVERKSAAATPPDLPWADPFLIEAKKLQTGLQPRIDQAMQLSNDGYAEEALTLIGQVLHDHPESDEAHLTRAKLLIRAKQLGAAEGELRQAIALNPNLVEGHFLLGGILLTQQDYAGAESSYERAAELKPTYGLAHFNLGLCLLQEGNKDRALEAFRQAVRYRPELASAHLELGDLLLKSGKVEEAITHLEDAVRLDGSNDRARRLLDEARAKPKPKR
jgi:tetratricopeptide (TPR) repeat protein